MVDQITAGDAFPLLTVTLKDKDGSVIDLTDAVVTVYVRFEGETTDHFERVATKKTPPGVDGIIEWEFEVTDFTGDQAKLGFIKWWPQAVWNTTDPLTFSKLFYEVVAEDD